MDGTLLQYLTTFPQRLARPAHAGRYMLLAVLVWGLLLGACARHPSAVHSPAPVFGPVADLASFPQDPRRLLGTGRAWPEGAAFPQAALYASFRERWLKPWSPDTAPLSAKSALWGIGTYGGKQSFFRDGKPRPAGWSSAIAANCAAATFPSLRLPGLVLQTGDLRVLPTAEPFFLDPSRPGEGYPFDYFQNSAIWAGTPVLITHQSADGLWLHVDGPYASGWMPRQQVEVVDQGLIDLFSRAQWAAVTAEHLTITAEGNRVTQRLGVGAVLPVLEQGPFGLRVGLPRRSGNRVALDPAVLGNAQASVMPVPFRPERVAGIAAGMQGQAYGWGGLDGLRDCSSLMRDLFTPFGIFLPRNSSQQAKAGEQRSLEGLSARQKDELLQHEGLPFRTLVNKPGHVMLYIGTHKGQAAVFHAIWGVRAEDAAGREARVVLGRTSITSLNPGAEQDAVKRLGKTLGDTLTSFTILPGQP
ncbi:SH3 domain-containing protein [Megalodesulfovibrio paquesii]